MDVELLAWSHLSTYCNYDYYMCGYKQLLILIYFMTTNQNNCESHFYRYISKPNFRASPMTWLQTTGARKCWCIITASMPLVKSPSSWNGCDQRFWKTRVFYISTNNIASTGFIYICLYFVRIQIIAIWRNFYTNNCIDSELTKLLIDIVFIESRLLNSFRVISDMGRHNN